MCISKRLIVFSVIIALLVVMFSGCAISDSVKIQPAITATKEVGTQENNKDSISDNSDEALSNSINTSASNKMDSWLGNYSFSEVVPPDQNMFYEISIGKEDNKYYAELSIDGFQTMQRLKANISGNENAIEMVFEKYLPGNVFEPYEDGEILLNFEKRDSKVYTTWGKVRPILECNLEPGAYFTKGISNSTGNQIITYVNNESGFALDFPKSWKGYYLVNDSTEATVKVSFVGRSNYAKGFNEETNTYDGLLMFSISSEANLGEFADSKRKIGTVDGVDYFYVKGTDYPIGGLKDYIDMDMAKDNQEKELLENDYNKAKKMEKDIDNILETFRVCP